MKKYRVYFKQINQDYVEVFAEDAGTAINLASEKWKRRNPPEILGWPEEM